MTPGVLAELRPQQWDELFEELDCVDSYLASWYLEASSVLEAGRPVFLQGENAVLACLLREIPSGGHDVVTPYGYGGPVAAGRGSGFWDAYERWCADNGVVSSFFRFHPRFGNHRLAEGHLRVERLGPTICWHLEGDLSTGLHRRHRRAVRQAGRAGVVVSANERPSDLEEFAALYRKTMGRANASSFYLFPDEYWQRLLRGGVVRFDARLGDQLVASAVCLTSQPWLHYHLGASSEVGRGSRASNLVLFEAACWAQERGYEEFHLGGGVGGREDSLLAFKEHFAPGSRLEMHIGKAVHDVDRYLELSGASSLSLEGYFPAYREAPSEGRS